MTDKRPLTIFCVLIAAALLAGCLPAAAEPAGEQTGSPALGGKELATAALTAGPGTPTTLPLTPTTTNGSGGLPYPTVNVTLPPTASPTFPLTAAPTSAEGPLTAGGCTVPYPYAYAWSASQEAQTNLRCPSGLPKTAQGAVQVFEHGFMFWRSSDRMILVITEGKQWYLVSDTFQEGQMEEDPAINPPNNVLEPVRGFGKVWRDNSAIRDALGWAIVEEYYGSLQWLDFEGGYVVSNPAGLKFFALAEVPAGANEGIHYGAVTGS